MYEFLIEIHIKREINDLKKFVKLIYSISEVLIKFLLKVEL